MKKKDKDKFIKTGRPRVKNSHLIRISGLQINLLTRTNEQLVALLNHTMLDYQLAAVHKEIAKRVKQCSAQKS